MPTVASIPPARRTDLILRPLGSQGQYVAKDPVSGEYFNLGEQEFFLLEHLDGVQSVGDICGAFEQRFGEPLTEADVNGFLELAQSQNFLQPFPLPVAAFLETTADLHLAPTQNGTMHRPSMPNLAFPPSPPPRADSALDEHELFLLDRIVKGQSAEVTCAAYERQFGEPLPRADLILFQEMARSQGYLPSKTAAASAPAPAPAPATAFAFGPPQPLAPTGKAPPPGPANRIPSPAFQATPPGPSAQPQAPRKSSQSLLYWRKSLFDPDRFFNFLAPLLSFIWTPTFVVLSLCMILTAGGVFWINRQEIADQLVSAWNWETAVTIWFTLLIATTCHEFAHGLTCKRYGGEVHEVGFLLMFLMPGFYCNVSDAWLIREKSKRLWVTLAGGYCDLCSWSLAVFVWRLTVPGTTPNHIAWVVVTVLGGRILFNFNPLLKLDGYYLLSDAIEYPNLQQRSHDYFKGYVRSLLWGAPTPHRERKAAFLLLYGITSWVFSLGIITVMLGALLRYLWPTVGWLAVAGVGALALAVVPRLFRGLAKGEVAQMLQSRRRWSSIWLLAAVCIAGVMFIPIQDRASGPFQVHCLNHFEARAKVAGFLRAVNFDEGDRIPKGTVLAVIEVTDLDSKLAQKRAEISEEEAKLALLEAGTRTEEKIEQRKRVERMSKWRDLAAQDLERASTVLTQDLMKWDEQIAQTRKDIEFAKSSRDRAQRLKAQNSISGEEAEAAERKYTAACSQLLQEQAQRRGRQAQSTTEAEAELARREKDFADARSTLALLEIGPRSEEIDAARAKINRMQEELHYLESIQQRIEIICPIDGQVLTPRLKERVGQFVHEGDLVALVEDPALVEAEIQLTELEVSKAALGQEVVLTARPMPFRRINARLDRIAPSATARYNETASTTPSKGETAGSITVYCQIQQTDQALRSGMTGYARVYGTQRRMGEILLDRALRYLRTEFWW